MGSITINKGDGYKIRATYKQVGAFDVIAVDWEHPNYGCFADGMLWYRSPHVDDWTPIHIAGWLRKYKNVDDIKKDYHQFAPLFDLEKPMRRILKKELQQYLKKRHSERRHNKASVAVQNNTILG